MINQCAIPPVLQQQAEQHWQQLAKQAQQHFSPQQLLQFKQLLGLSDFIAQSCIQRPPVISDLAALLNNPNPPDYQQQLSTTLHTVQQPEQLNRVLRHFRQLHMLRIAWLDLLGCRSIEDSLLEVSALADQLISHSYQWLYQQACNKYGTPLDDNGEKQDMLILAMGKLGGGELNFSSDIDLIFCYPQPGELKQRRKHLEYQQFFTRLAQQLINSLNQTTPDGIVFRVDMRLRPFGDSGALVSHFSAFEDYYQTQGREWERYAMVKARVCNANNHHSNELTQILKPFVYRRYLDFSAIDSLRQMKLQISKELKRRNLKHNIKLGAGGIREIEFIVQSFQLIRGGRHPRLQTPSLLEALNQLGDIGCIQPQQRVSLQQAYLFLRKVEHCLQQFNDQQIQDLPQNPLDKARLTYCMGFAEYADFTAALTQHQDNVHDEFNDVIGGIEENKSGSNQGGFTDLWLCQLSESEAEPLLSKWLSKELHQPYLHHLNELKSKLSNTLGVRGQQVVNQLMPIILAQASRVEAVTDRVLTADNMLIRLEPVLNAIAGRTTYLELLLSYPQASQKLLDLCAASPWIADLIASYPMLLDELISPQLLVHLPQKDGYRDRLRQHLLRIDQQDLETQMDALREFKLTNQLKIAAAEVTGVLDTALVSDHLSYLAEVITEQVVNAAWHQMQQRYGVPPGTSAQDMAFAVIAYGKLGGLELSYSSDLDLVLLHNNSKAGSTDGKKIITSQAFYLKLAQRINHLFSTKTRNGQLYEIDLRLRPSGNAGLLVTSIDSFADYQRHQAWVWEHQALVRARFILGSPAIQEAFTAIRQEVLCQAREQSTLSREIIQMRGKMRQHLLHKTQGKWDIKQEEGGITDIEFLVQYWVLAYASHFPQLTYWSDNLRIIETLAEIQLISQQTAIVLTQTYLQLRTQGHKLALQDKKALLDDAEFKTERQKIAALWKQTLNQSSDESPTINEKDNRE